MTKTHILGLLLFLFIPSVLLSQPLENLCGTPKAKVYDYSKLFLSAGGAKLWLDISEDELSGIFVTRESHQSVAGRMIGKNVYLVCFFQGKSPTKVSLVSLDPVTQALTLENLGSKDTEKLALAPAVNENPAVELSVFTNNRSIEVIKKGRTCQYTVAYFNITSGVQPSVMTAINKSMQTRNREYLDDNLLKSRCAQESYVQVLLRTAKSFISKKYVSYRSLSLFRSEKLMDLSSKSVVYDVASGKDVSWQSIFKREVHAKILSKVKDFARVKYGKPGRLESLEQVQMFMTSQAYVFTFVPVDAKGFYFDDQIVDVPLARAEVEN